MKTFGFSISAGTRFSSALPLNLCCIGQPTSTSCSCCGYYSTEWVYARCKAPCRLPTAVDAKAVTILYNWRDRIILFCFWVQSRQFIVRRKYCLEIVYKLCLLMCVFRGFISISWFRFCVGKLKKNLIKLKNTHFIMFMKCTKEKSLNWTVYRIFQEGWRD